MPLSRRLIAAYSSVAFAAELQSTFWGLYALHFLTENVGLEPLYTGILILLYRTWDAVNDTLFGFLSDRTTSVRWGKRRGWMMAGTLPYVITFALYWYPPFGENEGSELYSHNVRQAITFAWYFFLLFVCDAGFSAVNVAYLSLLGDITADPQEKSFPSIQVLRARRDQSAASVRSPSVSQRRTAVSSIVYRLYVRGRLRSAASMHLAFASGR